MERYEYLIILTGLFLVGVILKLKFNVHFYRSFKQMAISIFIYFIIGVAWDTFAISRGHWAFPVEKTLGIKIGLMPIEEYLFMLIVPFTGLSIYKTIDSKFIKKTSK